MSSPTIAIVTVNYRTPDLAIAAIESVRQERGRAAIRMYVVDNASGDDSVERIRNHIEGEQLGWVTLVSSPRNGGYSAGNNIALSLIKDSAERPDFIWLLNPDTRLRPGACWKLVEFMQARRVDIAGSRLEDEDGSPQVSAFNFPGAISELCAGARLGILDSVFSRWIVPRRVSDVPEPCGWLAGASLMMKFRVFEEVGMMDEQYFLYYEEVDYCLQAGRAGFTSWYVPDSRVFHAVGASTGISETRKRTRPRMPQYWFDSRRRYFLKNHGVVKLVLADTLFILGYASWKLRRLLIRKADHSRDPPGFLGDFIANSFLLRRFKGSS